MTTRTTLFYILVSLLLFTTCKDKEKDIHYNWEDPLIFAENQIKPHARLISYGNIEDILNPKSSAIKNVKSLNGMWKFKWVSKYDDASQNFYKPKYNVSQWDDMEVPGIWSLKGITGTNKGIESELLSQPPKIGGDNAVGSYRTIFILPDSWKNRQVIIRFESVKSAFDLWLNGQNVGYHEGENIPVEFNITPLIEEGENTVAVRVYQWCDGTYISSKKSSLNGGISGPVSLLSKPEISIFDIDVFTDLDDEYINADCKIQVRLKNYSDSLQTVEKVKLQLYDPNNTLIFNKDVPVSEDIKGGGVEELSLLQIVSDPAKWSTDHPNLYKLLVSLYKDDTTLSEVVCQNIGFRDIEINDGVLLINGKPLKMRGVNYNVFHPVSGEIVTSETFRKDVIEMKKYNINAIRVPGGVANPQLFDLCDEYGLLAWDETSISNYDGGTSLANNIRWQDSYLYRGLTMVARDKNHPSIIVWSLGDNAGTGSNLDALKEAIMEIDPSRPIVNNSAPPTKTSTATPTQYDIITNANSSIEEMQYFHDSFPTQPIILSEYINTTGNSFTGLNDYWEVINKNKRFQGGFISQWVMEGIQQIDEDSIVSYSPYNKFQLDYTGLMYPDRKATPAIHEVKKVYQFIEINPVGLYSGKIMVTNHYSDINLKYFYATWDIARDGKRVFGGKIYKTDISPGESMMLDLPYSSFTTAPGKEYFLNIRFMLPEDTKWAKAGYEVAWAQYKLPFYSQRPKAIELNNIKELNVSESDENISVNNNDFLAVIGKINGQMISYQYKKQELLKEGPKFNCWRPSNPMFIYKKQIDDLDSLLVNVSHYNITKLNKKMVRVYFVLSHTNTQSQKLFDLHQVYTIYGNGGIVINSKIIPTNIEQEFLKMGYQMKFTKEFDTLIWFGKGPYETYPGRDEAKISMYTSSVANLLEPYLTPQENGNRSEVRWTAITNDSNTGLFFKSDKFLNISAYHFNYYEIGNAESSIDIQEEDITTLNIDFKQAPLLSSLSPFTEGASEYEFMLTIQPLNVNLRSPVSMNGRRLPLFPVTYTSQESSIEESTGEE